MRSEHVPSSTVRAALLALLAMLGLVAAGCSGDGSPEAGKSPTPSAAASSPGRPGGQAEGLQREYEAVVRRTLTSVVQLTVSDDRPGREHPPGEGQARPGLTAE